MTSQDQAKNAQEQLDLITILVSSSRLDLQENGFNHMLWGAVVSLGTILNFVFFHFQWFDWIGYLWALLGFSAGFISFLYNRKKEKRIQSLSTKITKILWTNVVFLGLLVLYTSIFVPLLFSKTFYVPSIASALGFFSMLLGLAYILHSVLSEYRFLKVVGMLWIFGGYAQFFLPNRLPYLLMGIMAFMLEFVPGVYMFLQYQKEKKNVL